MMSNSAITVLLVDDDEMIRDCVGAYLEDEGFSVHGADSGEAGLEVVYTLRPAVCISDMGLPGMNGEEFILSAHALCPGTGYLLHTGMFYSLSDELLAIGMTSEDVLLKPVHDLSKLVTTIRRIAVSGRIK